MTVRFDRLTRAVRMRTPMLVIAAAAMLALSSTGCEAKVSGAPDGPLPLIDGPGAPTFDGLPDRIAQATTAAAADGATISVAVLDRTTKQMLSNGNDQLVAIASVAKLFIADDVLSHGSTGDAVLSSADRQALDSILRSSDDGAAETFWAARGDDTITDVASRYGLTSTAPPTDGRWWNTISSASDLVHYYDRLLDGSGGLSRDRAETIINDLAGSTADGSDGYRSGSAFPTGSTPNRSPSSRAGCVAWTAAAGCICPPASSAPTGAT